MHCQHVPIVGYSPIIDDSFRLIIKCIRRDDDITSAIDETNAPVGARSDEVPQVWQRLYAIERHSIDRHSKLVDSLARFHIDESCRSWFHAPTNDGCVIARHRRSVAVLNYDPLAFGLNVDKPQIVTMQVRDARSIGIKTDNMHVVFSLVWNSPKLARQGRRELGPKFRCLGQPRRKFFPVDVSIGNLFESPHSPAARLNSELRKITPGIAAPYVNGSVDCSGRDDGTVFAQCGRDKRNEGKISANDGFIRGIIGTIFHDPRLPDDAANSSFGNRPKKKPSVPPDREQRVSISREFHGSDVGANMKWGRLVFEVSKRFLHRRSNDAHSVKPRRRKNLSGGIKRNSVNNSILVKWLKHRRPRLPRFLRINRFAENYGQSNKHDGQ